MGRDLPQVSILAERHHDQQVAQRRQHDDNAEDGSEDCSEDGGLQRARGSWPHFLLQLARKTAGGERDHVMFRSSISLQLLVSSFL